MTTSNRFGNRFVLLIAGLVLAALAAAGIAIGAGFAPVRDVYTDRITPLADTVGSRLSPESDAITQPDAFAVLWPLLVIVIACIAIIAVSLALIFRRGHGQTGAMLTDRRDDSQTEPRGGVSIATGFARSALEDSLGARPDVLSVHVAAYRHGAVTALKVKVLPRSGVSPRTIVDAARESVQALDELVGKRIPVLLEIGSSARANLASADRVT